MLIATEACARLPGMNRMLSIATVFVALVLSPITHGAGLDALSSKDSVAGLKAALDQGATRAVASLGATDGFLGKR